MKCKKNKKQKINIIIMSTLLILLIMNSAQAQRTQPNTQVQLQTQIDDAKDVLEQYYEASKQKNTESYIKLHDEEYLLGIYGEEYKEFITEMLQIIDIDKYTIKHQYYTENNDAITLFFNLNANTNIDGEKVNMDNDLVAFYKKTTQGPKLRYIMLQTVFKDLMITETMLLSTTDSIKLEEQNLVEEAKQKGIITNEQIENILDAKKTNNLSKSFIKIISWLLVIIIISGAIYFIKNKQIINTTKIKTKKIKNPLKKEHKEKIKKATMKTKKEITKFYEQKIKQTTKKLAEKTKEKTKKFRDKLNEEPGR